MWSPPSFFCSLSPLSFPLPPYSPLPPHISYSCLAYSFSHSYFFTLHFPHSSLLFPLFRSILDDGLAPAVDCWTHGHYGLVRLSQHCWELWCSCCWRREKRPFWDCKERVSSHPVKAEERVDLELSLRGRGETCTRPLQDRTSELKWGFWHHCPMHTTKTSRQSILLLQFKCAIISFPWLLEGKANWYFCHFYSVWCCNMPRIWAFTCS